MSQREQKRKAKDLDKPIAQKMPRINIGNNADCQSTHCEALRQVFVKKKSTSLFSGGKTSECKRQIHCNHSSSSIAIIISGIKYIL